MRTFEKFILRTIFSSLFFSFVLLTTFNFQIFNKDYLFNTFEKHNVYERIPILLANSFVNDPNLSLEEKQAYTLIAQSTPSSVVKRIVEDNLSNFLEFIHGKSDDINVFFPLSQMNLGPSDLSISLMQTTNTQLKSQLEFVKGLGAKLRVLWFIELIALIGLFLAYGKFFNPKKILGGYTLLIQNGTVLLVISLILKFFLIQMARDLPLQPEPSQKLLGLLASSLFSEIVFIWMAFGLFTLLSGLVIFGANKYGKP